jgi:hypothetical protein
MGCPIRILRAHRLYAAPPERFAGLRVLLRLSAPRHPPRTLCSLFSSHICFLVILCFYSADLALSKIEDSSYSIVHVRLPVPIGHDGPQQLKSGKQQAFVFVARVSDRPGIEPRGVQAP